MRLWDTSVWVAASRRRDLPGADERGLERMVTCGPVVQEVLQGARPAYRDALAEHLNAVPRVGDPLEFETFVAAARIYQQARDRGFTIASPVDCLIAAIAIEYGVEVWHLDRDYETIARFTPLRQRRAD